MRRWLLFVISLGLVAAGVVMVLAGTDPPTGDVAPAPTKPPRQGHPKNEVAPMAGGDRTAILEQSGQPERPVPVSAGITFELRELVNRAAISRVDYTLLGPGGLRSEAASAVAPVRVQVHREGDYAMVFKKPGFLPQEVKFRIAADRALESKDRHLDITMERIQGRVRVGVRDRVTDSPMAGFKVRFRYRDSKRPGTWVGPVADTGHDLLVDLDQDALLQVEAPGYTPSEEKPVKVTADEPEAELVFFLERAMPFTGVELRVTDATLHPARNVRVVAEVKAGGSYRVVWDRKATREDGIYRLPELKPGSYRLTVRAAAPEGGLDMHVPFVQEIEFAGGEQHQLPVQLVAGGRILLKVTDQEGRLLGEGVQIRLLAADGAAVRTLWEHIDEAGKPLPFVAVGANGLVQDGRARLLDPVPPGHYRLQVRRRDGEVHTLPVTLEVGATKTVATQL